MYFSMGIALIFGSLPSFAAADGMVCILQHFLSNGRPKSAPSIAS